MGYVKNFTFDPADGFTGSATQTRKFADGGSVNPRPPKPNPQPPKPAPAVGGYDSYTLRDKNGRIVKQTSGEPVVTEEIPVSQFQKGGRVEKGC
jgi:hypothetical protein